MPSTIDPANPIEGAATTASVRANFLAAKNEIDALQAEMVTQQAATGTLQVEIGKTFGPSQSYSTPTVSVDTPIPNTTNRPIMVAIQLINSASGTFGGELSIDGIAWDVQYHDATTGSGTKITTLQGPVKAGSSYMVTNLVNCTITGTRMLS